MPARDGLSLAMGRWSIAGGFPWGTFAVNVLGCFGFGLIWSIAAGRVHLPADLQLMLLTGFFGACTTFATFQHETGQPQQRPPGGRRDEPRRPEPARRRHAPGRDGVRAVRL